MRPATDHSLPLSVHQVLLYMALAYGLPLVLMQITGFRPDYYNAAELNPWGLALLCATVVASLAVAAQLPISQPGMARPARPILPERPIRLAILAVLSGVALLSYISEDNQWRYSGAGLSESGSLSLYVYSATPLVLRAFLFMYLFFDQGFARDRGPAAWAERALMVLALFLSVNGNGTMVIAFFASLFILFPRHVQPLVITPFAALAPMPTGAPGMARRAVARLRRRRPQPVSNRTLLLIPVLLVPLLALGWLLGETVKRQQSLEAVLDWARENELATWILEVIVGRVSPSYFSAAIALDTHAFMTDWSVIADRFLVPLNSFLFRLNHLLFDLFDIARPRDGSIMRINYLMITPMAVNDREGTAPGLVAGFLYALPFPLNYATLAAYLLGVAWFIGGLARGMVGRLTWLGKLSCLLFLLPLFESPIDLMLVIDDAVIYLAILAWLRHRCMRTGPGPRAGPRKRRGPAPAAPGSAGPTMQPQRATDTPASLPLLSPNTP